MLKVILAYADTYEQVITDALNLYNAVEGNKIFHAREIYLLGDSPIEKKYSCEIWFTVTQSATQQPKDEFEFVGSKGIDPSDPNWRDKMFSVSGNDTSENDL